MNGPKLWADMLAAINIPGAVVAGGCIRDCFLNVPHKDIDIFVQCSSLEDWETKKYDFLDKLGNGVNLSDTQEGQEYDRSDFDRGKNPLYGVLEGEFMGEQVNIIARTTHATHEELISMFDFGILQAYYDGVSCKCTEAQRIDSMVRRATMMHDRHVEQSLARFFRFNKRNPGLLALAVPFEYQHNG